jgi:hypothetical protein
MTTLPPDDDLRARFQALRNREVPLAPAFSLAGADARRVTHRARRMRRAWYAAGGVALASAAAVALVVAWPKAPPFPIDLAGTTWTGPTDFLLDTPGSDMLRTVPMISISTIMLLNTTPPHQGDTSRRDNE